MPTKGVIIRKVFYLPPFVKLKGGFFMGLKDCLWCIGGASKGVSGCRFSLYPMADNFVEIILGALSKTDMSKVWKATDKLSTCVRGKRVHVFDSVKGLFVNAYRENVHMALEASFSKGCPGDTDADSFMEVDDIKLNESLIKEQKFNVISKISFYPMGENDYMEHIAHAVMKAKENGVFSKSSHYVSILEGDVHDVFKTLEDIFEYGETNLSHYILQVTISVNSPTKE